MIFTQKTVFFILQEDGAVLSIHNPIDYSIWSTLLVKVYVYDIRTTIHYTVTKYAIWMKFNTINRISLLIF